MGANYTKTIADLPHGTVRAVNDNELAIDSAPGYDDPPKLRLGCWSGTGSLGCLSADLLGGDSSNPDRHEQILIELRHDDDFPKDGPFMPCIEAYFQDVRVLRLTKTYLELFGQRVGASDRMTSGNGRFVTIQQDDGNFVTYDRTLGPIGDATAAVWSAWGGKA